MSISISKVMSILIFILGVLYLFSEPKDVYIALSNIFGWGYVIYYESKSVK